MSLAELLLLGVIWGGRWEPGLEAGRADSQHIDGQQREDDGALSACREPGTPPVLLSVPALLPAPALHMA